MENYKRGNCGLGPRVGNRMSIIKSAAVVYLLMSRDDIDKKLIETKLLQKQLCQACKDAMAAIKL